ncbi:MAG TPA: hypothetical protein VF602_08110 [Pedobacter sp.]|jgi:hypothetical protein
MANRYSNKDILKSVIHEKMMINNQSDKPENFEPKDSKRKDIKHPENDEEAVVKPEDLTYTKEEEDFGDVAKYKEQREQPVLPVKDAPKDV